MKQFALITGASSGIGLATAERFSKEDWEVANFSRRACPLEKIQNHLCDISDFSALRDTLKKLSFSGYERVSIIHNAAGTCKDSAMNATEKNLQKLLNINVVAPQIINQQLISLEFVDFVVYQ